MLMSPTRFEEILDMDVKNVSPSSTSHGYFVGELLHARRVIS